MPPTTYTCPECEVTLRPTKPFPPGKKVKCPKCGATFSIPGEAPAARSRQGAGSAKAAKSSPPPAAPSASHDEDDLNTYAFKDERTAEDEARDEERKRAVLGIVVDKAPRSKRGPAMATVVMPSNGLLAIGLINCLVQLFCMFIWIFPIIFNEHTLQPKHVLTDDKGKEIDKEWKDLQGSEKVMVLDGERQDKVVRFILLGCSIVSFVYAGFIAMGSIRMQNLDSYGWAMTGTIMALAPWCLLWVACLFWPAWAIDSVASWKAWWFMFIPLAAAVLTIPAGVWTLVTLRNQAVIAGFAEKPRY